MPTNKEHFKQYTHNKTIANSPFFSEGDNCDWKVTILYYSALHLIDSTYATKIHPIDHKSRKKTISAVHKKNKDIQASYMLLENLSRMARYNCKYIGPKKVKTAMESLKKIETSLNIV